MLVRWFVNKARRPGAGPARRPGAGAGPETKKARCWSRCWSAQAGCWSRCWSGCWSGDQDGPAPPVAASERCEGRSPIRLPRAWNQARWQRAIPGLCGRPRRGSCRADAGTVLGAALLGGGGQPCSLVSCVPALCGACRAGCSILGVSGRAAPVAAERTRIAHAP